MHAVIRGDRHAQAQVRRHNRCVVRLTFARCAKSRFRRRTSNEAGVLNTKVMELYNAGQYAEAIPLAQRALSIREKALGPDHPDLASSLENLAALYSTQERYTDAEALYKRSLAIRERIAGPENPSLTPSLNDLALIYYNQNRYSEAEVLHKRVLSIAERAALLDHPDVIASLNNLAVFNKQQHRFARGSDALPAVIGNTGKSLGFQSYR